MTLATVSPAQLQHQISGRVAFAAGRGGLPKVVVTNPGSTAEIYLQGAHVTAFQKTGEPPLLFLSEASVFEPGKPIRGGVPICYPWFGPREGQPMHGWARITEWELAGAGADGVATTLRFRPPPPPADAIGAGVRVEFVVRVAETLTMELTATNDTVQDFVFENCLHTYFAVGDIGGVSVRGLRGVTYVDKTDNAARKVETTEALRITAETNRVYLGTTSTVEIEDARWRRIVRVDKGGSASTVVWNPWTTQRMPDFDPAEHQRMLCVESGNVAVNRLTLAPKQTAFLTVTLATRAC